MTDLAPALCVCASSTLVPHVPSHERQCGLCGAGVWLSAAMAADYPGDLHLICERCAGVQSSVDLDRLVDTGQVHVRQHQLRMFDRLAPGVAGYIRTNVESGRVVLDP